MQYLKVIIIALIVSIVLEFLTKVLIEKFGKETTMTVLKTIAVVGITMFIKELI